MSKLLTMLFLLFLAGCAAQTSAPGEPTQTADGEDIAQASIQEIADEFKVLRTIKGHFEGGDWNDDIDKWMGRKHQLMIQLSARLGAGKHSGTQIVQALGPPDLTARQGDELFGLVSGLAEFKKPATGPYELLIYYWRGGHDFLYFTVQDEVVLNSGWWYAGD